MKGLIHKITDLLLCLFYLGPVGGWYYWKLTFAKNPVVVKETSKKLKAYFFKGYRHGYINAEQYTAIQNFANQKEKEFNV